MTTIHVHIREALVALAEAAARARDACQGDYVLVNGPAGGDA